MNNTIYNNFFSLAFMLSFFLLTPVPSFATVQAIALPDADNVVDFGEIAVENFSRHLDSILDLARGVGQKNNFFTKFRYATPEEARQFFSNYFSEKLSDQEKSEGLLERIFTDQYFGEDLHKRWEVDLNKLMAEHPALLNHLIQAWKSPTYLPAPKMTLEAAKKLWGVAPQLCSPKDVFEAFKRGEKFFGISAPFVPDIAQLEFDSNDERIKKIFSDQYFGIPKDSSERSNFYLNRNSLGVLDQDLIRNIFETSKRIMHRSKRGDYLVIFGNTPYFIGRALHHLASMDQEHDDYRVIVEFPFSGSPNGTRGERYPDYRNFVTRDRLEHLKNRMGRAGLNSRNEKLLSQAIYFIDVVGTGAGIAYTSELILRDFYAHGRPLPNLNIICLNKIEVYNGYKLISKIAQIEPDKTGHTLFYFPSNENAHFSIDAYQESLPGIRNLDVLPCDKDRVFPEYHASYWRPEYDYLLAQEKPEPIQILIEYFDQNIKKLLELDKVRCTR